MSFSSMSTPFPPPAKDSFVNASTVYGSLGSVRVVSASGSCISCGAVCSSPHGPQQVCEGQEWSWRLAPSDYDLMMEIPWLGTTH